MNLRQLLVVIDPAEAAQPALERAAWLARHTGAALELLACEFEQTLDGSLLFDDRQSEQARSALLAHRRARLEELAAPLRAEGLQVRLNRLRGGYGWRSPHAAARPVVSLARPV